MTDPVDTDALRGLGDWLVRSNVTHSLRVGVGIITKAADELDRLRAVIEDAQHADACWLRVDLDNGVLPEYRKCTCWKTDVL